jgi:hypothetical protein
MTSSDGNGRRHVLVKLADVASVDPGSRTVTAGDGRS